jgi:FkbM family methyltransferase
MVASTPTRRRLTALEASLVGLGLFLSGITAAALVLGPMVGRTVPGGVRNPEAEVFAAKYGPAQHSQFGEEWMIRDFFNGRRDGVFVDVGASDYKEFNNTYYLEKELGWSGLAIDPLRQFEEGYRLNRPRTRFHPLFVSDQSNEQAKIFFLKNRTRVTSSNAEFTAKYGNDAVELSSPTVTLNDLLAAEQIAKIDFLSMDIELAEPKALAGFDIQRFRPELVCIEAHEEVRQALLEYFARRGYVVAGKYLRADTQNLYFTPLSNAGQ